jgi:hypothetical protein
MRSGLMAYNPDKRTGSKIMEDEIINKIIKNQDDVLLTLKQRDIGEYCWIKERFEKGDILKDLEFQHRFGNFYIMNRAGLSDALKKRFFKLLSGKESDLECILNELYKIPTLRKTHSIQFSFATKLLHTVNNNRPIFDRMVSKIIDKQVEGNSKEEKIKSCVEIEEFLDNLYYDLIKDNRIKRVISMFRKKFSVDENKISDIKALDFIIWALGRIELN